MSNGVVLKYVAHIDGQLVLALTFTPSVGVGMGWVCFGIVSPTQNGWSNLFSSFV